MPGQQNAGHSLFHASREEVRLLGLSGGVGELGGCVMM